MENRVRHLSNQSWSVQLASAVGRYLVGAAQHRYAFVPFLLLALSDSLLPILPAEVMAVALMILQPHRALLIGIGFAGAAAASALIFAIVVLQAKPFVLQLYPSLAGALENGSPLISGWGAPALAALSIFPDSPRFSIAAATIAGLAPATIACAVFVGKLFLYLGLGFVLRRLTAFGIETRGKNSALANRVRPTLRRLAAFQRLLRHKNARTSSSFTRTRRFGAHRPKFHSSHPCRQQTCACASLRR